MKLLRAVPFLFFGLILFFSANLRADSVAVGQFAIESPMIESNGFYGFTVTNLTGGDCTTGYSACVTALQFTNATLTVNYGYGQINPITGAVPGGLGSLALGSYSVTASDTDPFNHSTNGAGVYGVDSFGDSAHAFELAQTALPIVDNNGNTLIILSAIFSTTIEHAGPLSGTYSATLYPTTDCGGGPCFNSILGYGYSDLGDSVPKDIVSQATPEPATLWLILPALGCLGLRRRLL
jgi:hypothetical protein